jgi:hypothetical protein
MAADRSKAVRGKLLKVAAIAAFTIALLSSLTVLVFLNPVPSRWCVDGNGCLFYTDNRWLTLWLGLPALGIGLSSGYGAWLAYRGSSLAIWCGALMLLLVAPAAWILFLLTTSKWQ